ncbi:hypothetical protein COU58_02455 [Candidatus Pacearchaeota archaeon CG10_big_fil_rev_8_21_14_0_10_32_42]|nr:MAG: hypothetical protein COU58_02455 [Candidatus Pacearchaeota archaeon CG10_big_fil_rev_8_21_14_0_10_32_42]
MKKTKKEFKSQPKVSIVFVNWDGKKDTFELLNSLKKISYPNYDVIIVDNGSSESIEEEFNTKYGRYATLILNKKNLGLAEGTNIGIREALKRKSKYILTMNNDMHVDKKFLTILVEKMEKNKEVAVAGPKIYYSNPSNMIWSAGCDYHLWGFKSRHQNEIDQRQADKKEFVDGIDCVLMMRSKILEKIGLLDKDFFIMDEFTEWCLRASKRGWKLLFVPDSKVWHKVSSNLGKSEIGSKISVYYWSRNWLLDIKKNKNFLYFFLILILHSTVFAIYRSLKYIKNQQPILIKYYYKGILDAIKGKKGQTIL